MIVRSTCILLIVFWPWAIQGSMINVCLECWNTLCGPDALPPGFNGCPDACLNGENVGAIKADSSTCCTKAATYVSSVSDTLISTDYISQQCESSLSSVLSTDSLSDVDQDSGGKQYVLYSSLQFNCTGCISNISIYSRLAVTAKLVFLIQLWTPKTNQSKENETILELRHGLSFDLLPNSEEQGSELFITSNNINNDSFCFEPGDIFGITAPGNYKFDLRKNSINNRKTYARVSPDCESLKSVYYLEDDELVDEPLVSVGVIQNTESTPTSVAVTSESTRTIYSTDSSSTLPASSVESHMVSSQALQSVLSSSPTQIISLISTTSSTTSTVPAATTTTPPFVQTTAGLVVVASSAVVVVLSVLVVSGVIIIVCMCICGRANSTKGNGLEMVGKYSRDSLDFQVHVPSRLDPSASINTSQLSTPTPPFIQNGTATGGRIPSTYYDDPSALDLDTSRLNTHDRNLQHGDYTTMHSRSTTSTVSNKGPMPSHVYDMPRNASVDSNYDEPNALARQVGTLDPYQQSQNFEESVMDGRNRDYFVLEVDSIHSINRGAHRLPVYHVLEQGYHVPSALERSSFQTNFNTDKISQQPFFEEQQQYWEPADRTETIYDQLNQKKCRELKRDDISFVEEIGTGQFGSVWSGVWLLRGGSKKNIALKVCKTNAKESEKNRLLREGARMMQFFHTHVVQLFGIVTVGEPIMLVIELMKEGDLKDYLRNSRPDVQVKPPLTPKQLVKFCRDIASGMKHLTKKKFVHRDLAARNIMLDEKLVCKIGDFGMTRSADHTFDLTKPEQIPLRWTAPEALRQRQYSESSDVYSYGMVMYEIWSLGRNPFPLEESNQIIIDFIAQGRIIAPPPGCPREIYRLMAECWDPKCNERPSFEGCSDFLMSDIETLLQWHSEDCDQLSSQKGMELGAEIQYGFQLYKDLQHQYRMDDEY